MRRRALLRLTAAAGLAAGARAFAMPAPSDRRAFTKDLVPGMIGVSMPFNELIGRAADAGFESVAPDAGALAALDDDGLAALLESMKDRGLVFGAAGLPVEFRQDEGAFREGMSALPAFADTLRRAGCDRVGTWLMPRHDAMTYRSNFDRHVERLGAVAAVLGDRGIRFGVEYVGPKTLWSGGRYPFIHTMAEALELIDAIGRDNVGLVLDSWHWYTAGESADDIRGLTNADVVACDLNDAPDGIPVDEQVDSRRALPAGTGVIDIGSFLDALVAIGYDGPVRAEPFSAELNAMPDDRAIEATAEALSRAFATID